MRAQLTSLTSAILFASSIQVLPPPFTTVLLRVGTFTFTMDISSETSTPHAPVLRLCPGLMSLQCGLPLEDWDDHPLCASSRVLDDPPCRGLFACPVCSQWPEDKRQRFLATRSITAGQRGTSFLSPPPDQSLPSFSSLLSVDLGLPPAPCPPTPPPSTGSTGLPPSLQDTLSSVLARLDSLESAQHSGGEKDSTLPPTAPAPARGLAGPARHRSRSPLQVDSEGFRSPGLHNPWGQAQHSHHNGHCRQEDTSTRKSPVSPRPRPLYYRYRRHRRRSPRSSPSPSSSGDRRRTGPYVYRRSPGRQHPASQYRSPQLPDGHQRRRPHSYAHRQQGDVTDATALVGRRPASSPPLTRVTAAPAQHDRRGARGSPPPLFRVPSPTRHVRCHTRSSSRDSSHNECRPDFGTRRHSRASSSCSHSRSCSRSCSQDEYNTSISFSSKLTLVRDIFAAEPSMQERPPTPPRSANVNVGSRRPSSSSSKPRSLPWNPSAARIHDSYWDLLRGKDPKSKSTDATGLPISTYLKKPRFRDRYYRISGEPDATFSAFVPSKFRVLQPTDKSATHAKPAFTDAYVADFEVQLKRTATILSFQDWFIGAVLELSRQLPLSSRSDTLTTLQELLYSVSRAGYDAQDHVSHLLFNLVLHRHDAYLRDTFTMLSTPTKLLLRSHRLNSRQLFDNEACTSALETFTHASNVSLLTQAIKSHSAAPPRRFSATNIDHRRRPPTPPQRQPSRDFSRSTRGKPRFFPSSFKKGGADLRTSIDLSPTDPSPSPVTVPPLPDFPVPALNDSPVGARLQLYWRNWQHISADPWVISVLRDGYYLPFSADPPPLTSDPPLLSYSRSHPLFQELTSQVQALLEKGLLNRQTSHPGFTAACS